MLNKTPVIFRKWRAEPKTVLAIFPADPGTNDPYTCSMFEHVGQHGSGDPQGVIERTRPATEDEYADLKRELESYPYTYDLKVVKKHTRHHLKARQAELKRLRK